MADAAKSDLTHLLEQVRRLTAATIHTSPDGAHQQFVPGVKVASLGRPNRTGHVDLGSVTVR